MIADYAIPLGIPVGRAGDEGRVLGRVFDSGTGNGLAGVLVRIGQQAALTEADGTFEFPAVPAGAASLTIDRLGPGLDRIPTRDLPLPVHVAAGRTARVEIGMVSAARLSGWVRVPRPLASARTGALEPAIGAVTGALVQLRNGDAVARRVTDARGRFEFADLRPGRWVLTLPAGLPEHHRLDGDSLRLDVAPGEATELVVDIVPVERPLRPAAEPAVLVPVPTAHDAAPGRTPARPAAFTVGPTTRGLMDVARQVYHGDASLWVRIWLVNRDRIPDPGMLRVGQVLRIPPPGPLTPQERAAARAYLDRR